MGPGTGTRLRECAPGPYHGPMRSDSGGQEDSPHGRRNPRPRAAHGPSRAHTAWILVALLLVGAVLRGAYAFERASAPDFQHPAVDAGFHDAWARSLAGIGDPAPQLAALEGRPYLRPPGYPYFLAGIYAATGGSRLAAVAVQLLLGLVSGWLTFRIGRRWFGDPEGLVAAGLVLVSWPLIYFEGELHAPALSIVLLLGALDLLGHWWSSGSRAAVFAAGLLLGCAALVRPNVLALVVVAAAWMLASAPRGAPGAARRSIAAALVLLLGTALAIAPVTLRNARVSGDAVLVSSNGGVNLYIGNHDRATGLVAAHLPGLGRFETCYDYPRIVDRLGQRVGRELTDSEASAWFAREALAHMRAEPARTLALTLHKARLFWGPSEIGHNKELLLEREHSTVLRHLPGPFPLTAALAFMGLCALWFERRTSPLELARTRRGAWLLGLCVAALFFSVLPFFAAARYRVPLIPVLAVFQGVGLVALFRAVVARRLGRGLAYLAAGSAAALVLLWGIPRGEPNAAKWHLDRARALRQSGDSAGAVEEARRSLAAAAEDPEAHFVLANALTATGDADGAVRHYRAALERRPKDHRVLNNLGSVLAETGDLEGAIAAFEAALERDPDPAPLHYNLGLVHERAGRPAAAAAEFEAALGLRPGWGQARRALGRVRGLPSDDGQANLPR